jgi:hypothetical protein
VTLRRLSFWAVVIVIVGEALWVFAPVLFFVAVLLLALGLLSAAMIALARRLRDWRERR